MALIIIFAIAQVFGMFVIGWIARRLDYLREDELNRWSRFVIDFLIPALMFHSIVDGFESERLGELWTLPIVGFGCIGLGAVTGIVFRLGIGKNHTPEVLSTFHHFCAINNYGFLPIIIIQNLWGAKALANLFLFNLGSTVGYWTIGVALLEIGSMGNAVKNILSPSMFAIVGALIISAAGWSTHIPGVIMNIFGSIGAAAVPLILILVGAGLYPFPVIKHKALVSYLTVIRLLALPAVTVGILVLLPLPQDVKNIGFVVAVMPTSVSSIIMTRRYGGDPDFAAEATVVTTVTAIITVPIWLAFLI
ncbi:MAG: AEC family transporter [Lentisphaerae bacterium]|nr:AEC family transporter [Lentisphaerota bacterium]